MIMDGTDYAIRMVYMMTPMMNQDEHELKKRDLKQRAEQATAEGSQLTQRSEDDADEALQAFLHARDEGPNQC